MASESYVYMEYLEGKQVEKDLELKWSTDRLRYVFSFIRTRMSNIFDFALGKKLLTMTTRQHHNHRGNNGNNNNNKKKKKTKFTIMMTRTMALGRSHQHTASNRWRMNERVSVVIKPKTRQENENVVGIMDKCQVNEWILGLSKAPGRMLVLPD